MLIHRKLLRGQHVPKDKCTQNLMLFMVKGEMLINSDEYPGTTLTRKNSSSCKLSAQNMKHWHFPTLNIFSSHSMNYPCFVKIDIAKLLSKQKLP